MPYQNLSAPFYSFSYEIRSLIISHNLDAVTTSKGYAILTFSTKLSIIELLLSLGFKGKYIEALKLLSMALTYLDTFLAFIIRPILMRLIVV